MSSSLFPLFKFMKRGTRVVAKDPFRSVSATFSAFNTGLFSSQFEKADDLLSRRRFAERMPLETQKGSLLDDCDDSAVTISPVPRHLEPWLGARSHPQ